MILKCINTYIDLTCVGAYTFNSIQRDAETGGIIAALTFYIVPKPVAVGIRLTENDDIKEARKILELVGESIAKLIYAAKRKESETHMEDLSKIVMEAKARVAKEGNRK